MRSLRPHTYGYFWDFPYLLCNIVGDSGGFGRILSRLDSGDFVVGGSWVGFWILDFVDFGFWILVDFILPEAGWCWGWEGMQDGMRVALYIMYR